MCRAIAFRPAGIKVPDTLAIISFDQSGAFDFFYSPLTYVAQSLSDIGKEAVKLIINRINDSKKKTTNVIIEAKLVLRDSCGTNLNRTKTETVQ